MFYFFVETPLTCPFINIRQHHPACQIQPNLVICIHKSLKHRLIPQDDDQSDASFFLCLKSVSTGEHSGPHHQAPQHWSTNLSARSAVECGAGGPLAGLVSFRILQARIHSAAGRAGTIHDGNIRRHVSKSLHPPSGMVDPHDHNPIPPSPAEPIGYQNFA